MQKLLIGALGLTLMGLPAVAAPISGGTFMVAAAPSTAIVAKAHAQRVAGNYGAALAILEDAQKKFPGDAAVLYEMAFTYDRRGDYDEALEAIKKAVAADDSYENQILLAHSLLMVDKYDAAMDLCDKLESHPGRKSADAWSRSELYVVRGGAQGLKAKREGVFAMIRYGLGVRKEFEKGVDTDSDNPRAHYTLGRYFLEAPGAVGGDPKKGTTILAKAAKMDDMDFVIRGWYVRGLIQTNDADAKAQAERYVKDFSDLPASKKQFADVYNKAK
ncbi:MAG TPA: tetratricopeptide repeat protein [Stenomitos sp.]